MPDLRVHLAFHHVLLQSHSLTHLTNSKSLDPEEWSVATKIRAQPLCIDSVPPCSATCRSKSHSLTHLMNSSRSWRQMGSEDSDIIDRYSSMKKRQPRLRTRPQNT
jgi:hypothetical protein